MQLIYALVVRLGLERIAALVGGMLVYATVLAPQDAAAVPSFARQTGQNCVSCHAGGQFPELTPYGRMFKLTGYTIGERAMPLAVMGVAGYSRVADTSKDNDPQQTFAKNGSPSFETGSLFIAGKVTDNIGGFVQVTYDNYASQKVSPTGDPNGTWQGHSGADNMDFRYADHLVGNDRDLIFGLSVNNNPSVSDPWNTAPAWMQYVPAGSPGSFQFADANTPFPGMGPGNHVAGINAYLLWNKAIYGEIGFYRTANQVFSFMNAGSDRGSWTKLAGNGNPYWRLAYTHEWGAHNLMVGTSGMVSHVYDDPTTTADPNSVFRVKDAGVDAQYQYLLDPHAVTAQFAYMTNRTNYSLNTVAGGGNASDTVNNLRAKLSYVYRASYGGSLAFFSQTGTFNPANATVPPAPPFFPGNLAPVTDNVSGHPGTRGFTYEAFWLPVQYVRVGAQYTAYSQFNGAGDNYNGSGRNARDNNTLFLYVWGAY